MGNISAILALITEAFKLGGDMVPIALRAYAALKAETGLTDAELTAHAEDLNALDDVKAAALIAETGG